MNVYIFGDSIMRGVVLDEKENRYRTISENNFTSVGKKFSLVLKNMSRFGSTLPKGIKIIDKALDNKMKCDYALVEFGGNDCFYDWEKVARAPEGEHLPYTTPDQFRKLYFETINKLKNAGIIPVLMTLPPIDSDLYVDWVSKCENDKTNIIKWLGDKHMMYRWHEFYSDIVAKIAAETKTLCADIRSEFLKRHDFKMLLCRDGIHPNEQGHTVIKNAFEAFLSEVL